jgi:hypothetical protein
MGEDGLFICNCGVDYSLQDVQITQASLNVERIKGIR